MKRFFANTITVCALCLGIGLPWTTSFANPVVEQWDSWLLGQTVTPKPQVSAQSYIITDAHSGQILLGQQIHLQRNCASLTKLMTALIVVENHTNLDEVVSVPPEAPAVDPKKMGLRTGDHMTLRSLIKGALIESANDAAMALAITTGGDKTTFVNLMNQKAKVLGMLDTHFTNPIGFDDDSPVSSAQDIATLSFYVMRNPVLHDIVGTSSAQVTNADGTYHFLLKTTNDLLGQNGTIGIKTGSTPEAGETLALDVRRDNLEVIIVLFGSLDRFADGRTLTTYALNHFVTKTFALPVPQFNPANLFSAKSLWAGLKWLPFSLTVAK